MFIKLIIILFCFHGGSVGVFGFLSFHTVTHRSPAAWAEVSGPRPPWADVSVYRGHSSQKGGLRCGSNSKKGGS